METRLSLYLGHLIAECHQFSPMLGGLWSGIVNTPGLTMAPLGDHDFPLTNTPLSDYEPILTPTYAWHVSGYVSLKYRISRILFKSLRVGICIRAEYWQEEDHFLCDN
jgi:hypothetical protein